MSLLQRKCLRGKHILFGLLSGILKVEVSAVFAKEPQRSGEEIFNAWGQTQLEVAQFSDPLLFDQTGRLTPLTGEELDQITGGIRASTTL